MSADWFDLGQRFRAASIGVVQPRLLHAPAHRSPHPVAVRASVAGHRITVTAATATAPSASATGPEALALLGSLGVTLAALSPATLVTDQPTTLGLLTRLAATTSPGGVHDDVAAHIAWWRDRVDYPGGLAVMDTVAACRARWVTGRAPMTESDPGVWRHWLDVPDDSPAGLLTIHQHITAGAPLGWLDTLAEDGTWAYGAAQRDHADGRDWRRPDTTSRAATGLRSRCDAADLYAAALLTDPMYRARAVHTGHVVTGTAHPLGDKLRRCEVTSDRLDARLRPGNEVLWWIGTPTTNGPTATATVSSAAVLGGNLVLTLAGVAGPVSGQPITLAPAPPNPHRQRAGRRAYRALYATRQSWLTTGRTPTLSRRPVPLDVLVAAADPTD